MPIVKPEQPKQTPDRPRGFFTAESKFVSITANARRVMALDENGQVWYFDETADAWYRLSRTRAP